MSGDGSPHPPTGGGIPAGWYPDPAGSAAKRWWDGAGWTENLQEPEKPPATTFGAYIPPELRTVTALPTAEVGIGYTRSSWWIAGSPLWVAAPQAIIVGVLESLAPPTLSSLIPGLALINLVVLGVLILLAFADRTALINGGNNSAASPWWTLLTPLAYLIARARHVQLYASGGWASVLWLCIAAVLAPGVSVLGIFAGYGLL
jgi:Protein of unknown function (DUF2510)